MAGALPRSPLSEDPRTRFMPLPLLSTGIGIAWHRDGHGCNLARSTCLYAEDLDYASAVPPKHAPPNPSPVAGMLVAFDVSVRWNTLPLQDYRLVLIHGGSRRGELRAARQRSLCV